MTGSVLLLLGFIGLAAGAGKVRKLAGINGYISDHPDERCEKIGDFLLHPYNRCSYLVCDYGHEPWKDDYGRTKLFARIMPCAPGTAVPSDAYRQGQHKLNPNKVCTQHYSGKCPARVQSYHGNFYGSSHHAPRHQSYDSHDSYDSQDSYRPSSGYGLRGGYGYEAPSHSYGYRKRDSYGDDSQRYYTKNSYGGNSHGYSKKDSYGDNSHGSSYGSRHRTQSSYAPSSPHGHGSSYSSGSSNGYHGSSSGSSYGRPSSHGRHSSASRRPSSRGRYTSRGRGGHRGTSRYGRRPSIRHSNKPIHHSRPSMRPSYRHTKSHSHREGHPSRHNIGGRYNSYGFGHSPHLSFKKGATANKAESEPTKDSYEPSGYARKESNSYPRKTSYTSYPRKESSYPPQKQSYQGSSYNTDSYPRKSSYPSKSQGYSRREQYPSKRSSSYGLEKSYSSKPQQKEQYQIKGSSSYGTEESYPSRPAYSLPRYAKAPNGIKYPPAPEDFSYPSAPKGVRYPSVPKDIEYPSTPDKYSDGGYQQLTPHRGSQQGAPQGPPRGHRSQSSYRPQSPTQQQGRYQSARSHPQYPATPPVRPKSRYQQNSYHGVSDNQKSRYNQDQGYQGESSRHQMAPYQGGSNQAQRQRPYPAEQPSSSQGGYRHPQY